jgi:hypothetical protein
MSEEVSITFREAVGRLHGEKNAAYRNAWKRRGETISIIANIARKVDRIESVADGAPATVDESLIDTAVDLLVYVLKYQTFLADQDKAVAMTIFRDTAARRPYSDGVDGFDALLARSDLAPLEAECKQGGIHSAVSRRGRTLYASAHA